MVVVALVGCGDNLVDESADDRSGTQLKLRWFEYSDGARELAWSSSEGVYFDSRFDTRCEPIEWADGVTRCTPGVHARLTGLTYAVGAFTDDACTQLVGRSLGDPDFVALGELRGDQHYPTQLLRGGKPLSILGPYYERRDDGCAGPFTAVESRLYEVGALVPTADLVALVERELPTTGRLAHRTLEGSDGSGLWLGFHDRELAVDCSTECIAGGSFACVPKAAPPGSMVLDQLASITFAVERTTGRRLADRVSVAGSLRATVGLFDTATNAACSAGEDLFGDIFADVASHLPEVGMPTRSMRDASASCAAIWPSARSPTTTRLATTTKHGEPTTSKCESHSPRRSSSPELVTACRSAFHRTIGSTPSAPRSHRTAFQPRRSSWIASATSGRGGFSSRNREVEMSDVRVMA
jgi:hypothetical protein